MDIAIYLGLGAFAGLVAGLLGAGGGSVLVPGLVFIFAWKGLAQDLAVHMAIATSLATMIVTSAASTLAHHRSGAVLWQVFRAMLPGLVIGAIAGAVLAHYVPDKLLGRIFGAAMLLIALDIGLGRKPSPQRHLPRRGVLSGIGSGIGLYSALLGMGGSSLTVPFLLWCNTPPDRAVATSATVGVPIAICSTLGYVLLGSSEIHQLPWSLGYVYLPAALGIVLTTMVCAPLGAYLAHRLSGAVLKRLFALLVLGAGIKMLIGP